MFGLVSNCLYNCLIEPCILSQQVLHRYRTVFVAHVSTLRMIASWPKNCHAKTHMHLHALQTSTALYTAGSANTRPAPPLAPAPPTPSNTTSSSFKLSWACPQARGAPVTEYMVNLQHVATAVPSTSVLSNGHTLSNGNSVLNSLDDTSSTSGSTAQTQVGRGRALLLYIVII